MSSKHLSRKPHQISDHAWWYETPKGLAVIVQSLSFDSKQKTGHTAEYHITWQSVRAALRRKDRPEIHGA